MKTEPVFFEINTVTKAGEPPNQNGVPAVERLPDGRLLAVWSHNPFIRDHPVQPQNALEVLKHPGFILGAFSSDNGCTWTEPVVLAEDADGDPSLTVAGDRVILHYNVTTYLPRGRQILFGSYTLWQRISLDSGKTWGKPQQLDFKHDISLLHGNGIRLRDGTLVRPYYFIGNYRKGGEILEAHMIAVSTVLTSEGGELNWREGGHVRLDSETMDEPSIVELSDGSLYMLVRTNTGRLYQTGSRDRGKTWETPSPSVLNSPGAPCALYRLSFEPNRIIVVWNNSTSGNRFPLDIAISYDDCKTWPYSRTLFNSGRQVAYPSITTASDGSIIVVFHEASDTSDKRVLWHCWRNILAARISEEWIRG